MGIDVGSGYGWDTYTMAKNNPAVEILSTDLSGGIYKTWTLTLGLENVRIIKYSVLQVYDLFTECGFSNIMVTRLSDNAGWVAWGYKNNA